MALHKKRKDIVSNLKGHFLERFNASIRENNETAFSISLKKRVVCWHFNSSPSCDDSSAQMGSNNGSITTSRWQKEGNRLAEKQEESKWMTFIKRYKKNWSIKIWPLGWHNETVWMAKPPMHSSRAIKYLEKHLNRVNYVVQVRNPDNMFAEEQFY